MEQIIYLWIGLGYLALAASHSSPNHAREQVREAAHAESETNTSMPELV